MCSQALANFFIEKSQADKIPITNMKLQKLMFIGYGWVVALTGNEISGNESFEAWTHGPVLPSIYHEMKHYGDNPIKLFATTYDFDDNIVFEPKIKTDQTILILNKAWDVYKGFSAWALRELTHEDGTPWKNAYAQDDRGARIPTEEVDTYYTRYIEKLLEQ